MNFLWTLHPSDEAFWCHRILAKYMPAPNKFPANRNSATQKQIYAMMMIFEKSAVAVKMDSKCIRTNVRAAFVGPNKLAYMLQSGPFEMRNIPIGFAIVWRVFPIHSGVKCAIKNATRHELDLYDISFQCCWNRAHCTIMTWKFCGMEIMFVQNDWAIESDLGTSLNNRVALNYESFLFRTHFTHSFNFVFRDPSSESNVSHRTPPYKLLFRGDGVTTLTQLTTGGKSDAEIATPIIGPAAPRSRARATPVPDVRAHATPIHNERALPLFQEKMKEKSRYQTQNYPAL